MEVTRATRDLEDAEQCAEWNVRAAHVTAECIVVLNAPGNKSFIYFYTV